MSTKTTTPKVFISYSWQPISNKEKVIELAERLTANGVHVLIDVWDLKEGHDKHKFMEQMVNSLEIKRVLLICNKDYAEKANNRVGGVGIESLIISNDIYSQVDQAKFIPLIFEYDRENKACVPTFVNSRIYLDLSSEEVFEENFHLLMRNLFDKPLSKRPILGSPPAYLFEEEPVYLPTAYKVAGIKKALLEERKNAILFINDYYDSFLSALSNFYIDDNKLTEQNYDTVVLGKIHEFTALRNDFINFLEVYFLNSVEIDLDRLHGFFDKLMDYISNIEGIGADPNSFRSIKVDHYRFFFYELFLYFACICIKKERFKELGFILKTPFVIYLSRNSTTDQYFFPRLKHYVNFLKLRNEKLQLRRVSPTADLMKERATAGVTFAEIQQADAILYYISLFLPHRTWSDRLWYPETTCYPIYEFPLINKAISKRFFDKLKILFDVNSKEELIAKVAEVNNNNRDKLERWDYELPSIEKGLKIETICSLS